MDDNPNKDDLSRHAAVQHACRSVKDVIITLNGVMLGGVDMVMFTPEATDDTLSKERHKSALGTYGTILSSDATFNRAFDWQAAQKHTDVQHMKADISIKGIFSCAAADEAAQWTLHNVEITDVNRDVDLLEPGTEIYQFHAIAEKK